MTLSFAIIASMTVAAAVAAMGLRNIVHCALALTVALAGLAAAYLQLDAQFAGFAQILVYVGAVAILVVFAILLTRSGDPAPSSVLSPGWLAGAVIAVAVLGVLVYPIARSPSIPRTLPPPAGATVHQIGDALMGRFVLPLEVTGLLLTVALIGAVIIAMREKEPNGIISNSGSEIANRKSQIANSP
jgi:NADH-quinone oxidoreductase subunit J